MEFIGLEAEAVSAAVWQIAAVPGLLQTEEYARAVHIAHQQVLRDPPGGFERRVAVRMIRQQLLTTRDPPLKLSAVIDESVLLRKVGSREGIQSELYIEGETDTYTYRIFFVAFVVASLPPDESRELILQTAHRL
jgi:hypothetical protein